MQTLEFIIAFREFVQHELLLPGGDPLIARGDPGKWSHRITGRPYTNSDDSPLGSFLARRRGKGLRYLTRTRGMDLVLASDLNWTGPDAQEAEGGGNDRFFPITYDLTVRYEQHDRMGREAMMDLLQLRARTKVLIICPEKGGSASYGRTNVPHITPIRTRLHNLLRRACSDFPENRYTEYVLIIGCPGTNGTRMCIDWHLSIYSYEDNSVKQRELKPIRVSAPEDSRHGSGTLTP